jgi:hypothetical protein
MKIHDPTEFKHSLDGLFDFVAVPLAGTACLALTAFAWFLGSLTLNGRQIRYPEPEFLSTIAVSTTIGLVCWLYAGFRYRRLR